MKIFRITAYLPLLIILCFTNAFSQGPVKTIPKIIEKGGRHALLVDGKPFFMLGGQVHNSSAWPDMLPQVWSAVNTMKLNTLEVPLYWEQIEAQPGKFNFSLVNTLLVQARQHRIHLVLLWFGTWKNGSNHYIPGWIKKEAIKYPNITGRNGQPVDSPSPHIQATLDADINAFTSVMKYLKKADRQHTVIMVQVENEAGAWGSVRDYSALAQKIFDSPLPAELLKPEVLKALNVPVVAEGTWQQVFGNNADEYFHAWSIAHFIGRIAAAGKAVNPLPLYVNAALRDPITKPNANTYESGGPTDNVIPIWKAAAPAIDLLAPDIYLTGSEKIMKVIDLYDRPDNAIFVPEAALTPNNAKYLYEVIARGGIGFSPFGIDVGGSGITDTQNAERLALFTQEYAMAGTKINQLAKWGFDGKIKAVIEQESHQKQTVDLGAWEATVSFEEKRMDQEHVSPVQNGKIMIIKLGKDKFMVIGTLCHITFRPVGNNQGKAWQYLKVEEGVFKDGIFKVSRILNGDETDFGGPRLGNKPTELQIELIVR